jgi:hypothetical protein
MTSVHVLYDQDIKSLPVEDREELVDLILGDLAPSPPLTVNSRENLIQMLEDGLNSAAHLVTDETWSDIREEIRHRHEAGSINLRAQQVRACSAY